MIEDGGISDGSVPEVSQSPVSAIVLLIDSAELAKRLGVPVSWVRNHTRGRTPLAERIPCVRFGRYVRFDWNSARLRRWLERRCS
jgi:hypothetical protein